MVRVDNGENPLISIVVPIYNVEKYLNQCINSIVKQLYDNLEIILVDDGSVDGCSEICDKWAQEDQRITVVHKANGGLSDARNAGIRAAHGSYIAFVDSDDWIEDSFVQNLYDEIQSAHSELAECSVKVVDESGVFLKYRKAYAEQNPIERNSALKHLIEENGIYQTVWNKLYKMDLVKTIPFETGKYHEDEFWTYKVIGKTERISVVDVALYNYRQRTTSIMGNAYSLKRLDGLQAKFERMQYFQNNPDLYTLCSEKLLIDCLWNLQMTERYLNSKDKKRAQQYILEIVNQVSGQTNHSTELKLTTRCWLWLFSKFPVYTAKIRNMLKIGY